MAAAAEGPGPQACRRPPVIAVPGATLQAGVRNKGAGPLRLVRTMPMDMTDQKPQQRVALRTAMASAITSAV